MKLIDGRAVAEEIKSSLKIELFELTQNNQRIPTLAAILVGDNPASKAYVNNKVKTCKEIGFNSLLVKLPSDISEADLLKEVERLNNNAEVDGFIVQLPLPKHIDEVKVTLAIDPKKDVDGFHPINFGRMAQGLPCYLPATPYGITLLLKRYNIETAGKHVVVVGRSNIPGFITEDMVKEGAVVVDVGINRVEDDENTGKSKLVGDVDFDGIKNKSSYITPVPGGVGPMTVMGLIMNTLKAAKKEIYP